MEVPSIPALLRLAAQWLQEDQSDLKAGESFCADDIVNMLAVRTTPSACPYDSLWRAACQGGDIRAYGSTRARALCALAAELEGRDG